ncbi:hypothetical protein BDZ89DRAFT_1138456 [Hymenopellis radicata]|nr:hypothetical protein BDZ89DRAFT_1138456 [Hymenopellis radicata]
MQATQGTRITNALDALESEVQMLIDSGDILLTQGSQHHRQEICREAHTRLNDILAKVPCASSSPHDDRSVREQATPSPSSHRTPHDGDARQVSPDVPQLPDLSSDPRWLGIMKAVSSSGHISADEFVTLTLVPSINRHSTQMLEDQALIRLLRAYVDQDDNWVRALNKLKNPYQSSILDMYSHPSPAQYRDQTYRELLTAQHRNRIHALFYHIASFTKQCELLEAVADWQADTGGVRTREQYASEVFPRRYKHIVDRLEYGAPPPAEQGALRKEITGVKRVFKKRFLMCLERADLLYDLHDSFGATVLLDPFWHMEWLEEGSSFTKQFPDLLRYACLHVPTSQHLHGHAERVVRHVASILGDTDSVAIVDEWSQNHQPSRLSVEEDWSE